MLICHQHNNPSAGTNFCPKNNSVAEQVSLDSQYRLRNVRKQDFCDLSQLKQMCNIFGQGDFFKSVSESLSLKWLK